MSVRFGVIIGCTCGWTQHVKALDFKSSVKAARAAMREHKREANATWGTPAEPDGARRLGYTWGVTIGEATVEQLEFELMHLNDVIDELDDQDHERYATQRAAVRRQLGNLYREGA